MLVVAAILSFSACNHDEPCTVNIRVVDQADVNVGAGYNVVFRTHRATPNGQITGYYNRNLITDADGKVSVTYGLPAIIEASVYSPGQTDFSQANELQWVTIKLIEGDTKSYKMVLP